MKLHGVVGSLQLSCGDSSNLVCKGSVAASKGTNSGITASRIVRGREENKVALVAFWGVLCLHTAPTGTYFPLKERNSGNTSSSPPTPLLVNSCLTFASLLVVTSLLDCVLVVIASYRLLT